jgi:YD repeat-containing protein
MVSVVDTDGAAQAGLSVYAFDGEPYSGYSGTTDDAGQVVFTLPECEIDAVTLPGGTGQSQVTIEYMYDALNRLTSATYSNGTAFSYTYRCNGKSIGETGTKPTHPKQTRASAA